MGQARWFFNPLWGQDYKAKLYGIQSSDLLAYWPLDEKSGSTADNYEGTAAYDGTYTGVTLANTAGPDGPKVPYWDGANDYLTITGINPAFNGDEGTFFTWIKSNDVTQGGVYVLRVHVGNDYKLNFVYESANGGTILCRYTSAGVTHDTRYIFAHTNWFSIGATWSLANDEYLVYADGSPLGAAKTGHGPWVGEPTLTYLGALNATPTLVIDGWLAHPAFWTAPLSATKMAALANP